MKLRPFALAAFLSLALTVPSSARTVALVGGRLIDGFGGPPLANSVILIEGERITAVGRVGALAVPPDAEVISTEGMSVLPGLWDCHVHTMLLGHSDYAHWDKTYPTRFGSEIMPAAAQQLLMAGVTSARDLGAPLKESIEVRDRINRGEIPGPTLYVSGPFLQHEPYPGTEQFRWGIKGVADAKAKVKQLADAGVNIIKLIDQDQMTPDEVKAVVDEAHARKLPVVAHGHRPEEIRRGLAAGADCFEHTGLATAPGYPEDVLKALAERTAKMSLGPLFWCPTIEGFINYEHLIQNPEQLDDPAWQVGVPADIVEDIKRSIAQPGQLAYYQITPLRAKTVKTKFKQLQDAGVVLLDRHRQRHPDEVPQQLDVARARRVGQSSRRRRHDCAARRDLLARRADEGRQGLRLSQRRQVRRHHRRERRRVASHRRAAARGCHHQTRQAREVAYALRVTCRASLSSRRPRKTG
jgi:hypothetical protein